MSDQIAAMFRRRPNDGWFRVGRFDATTTDIICEMMMFAKTSYSKDVTLDHLKHRFGQLVTDLVSFENDGELPASLEKYGVLEQFYQG